MLLSWRALLRDGHEPGQRRAVPVLLDVELTVQLLGPPPQPGRGEPMGMNSEQA
ncbi:MAG TPA: hypothetical protein VIX84_08340 [Acidimicrobiales bacterium]